MGVLEAEQPIRPVRPPRLRASLWRLLRLLGGVAGSFLALQTAVVATLVAIARQRRMRSPERGFPYLELHEESLGENQLQLYTYGQDLYDAMLEAIDSATESIYFETFIWKGDAIGEEFKRQLVRKAREGVRVYVIFDNFGNLVVPHAFKRSRRRSPRSNIPRCTTPGTISIRAATPSTTARCSSWMAVKRSSAATTSAASTRPNGATRTCASGSAPRSTSPNPSWTSGIAAGLRTNRIQQHYPRRFDPTVRCTAPTPLRLTFPIRNMYIEAIDRAERHILLTNAYFVPDHVLLEALAAAAQRGVDVQILLPWNSNHVVTDWVARGYFSECLASGIRIFGYKHAMIHAKTCTIDGEWSTIGTANLDRLSSVGNYELNVEVYSDRWPPRWSSSSSATRPTPSS